MRAMICRAWGGPETLTLEDRPLPEPGPDQVLIDEHPNGHAMTAALFHKLSRVTYGAFAYVILAGAVRAYYFEEFEWNPAVGRGQTAALVVKHVILFAVTWFGIVVHRRYQRRYGRKEA